MTKRWVAITLSTLVVLNIVLIAWAYQSVNTPPVGSQSVEPAAPPGATTEATQEVPAGEPSSAETEEPAASELPTALPVLTALNENEAFRVSAAECPGEDITIEFTDDGGDTWDSYDAPGVSAPQRILAQDSSRITLVGLGDDACEPTALQSFVGGVDWTVVESIDGYWVIDGGEVSTPSAAATTPCSGDPAQLAVVNDLIAFVLCADRNVAVTTDASEWSDLGQAPGVLAIGAESEADASALVAVAGVDECDGVSVRRITEEDATGQSLGCADMDSAEAVAISSAADGTIWLWGGDDIARSTDGGVSWS